MKYKRYSTEKFELDTTVKQNAGLDILAYRQTIVDDLNGEMEAIEEEIRSKLPELYAQRTQVKSKLKHQKKFLKETLLGLKRKPYIVYADVVCQKSITSGYLEYIDKVTDTLMLQFAGTEDMIDTEQDTTE